MTIKPYLVLGLTTDLIKKEALNSQKNDEILKNENMIDVEPNQ